MRSPFGPEVGFAWRRIASTLPRDQRAAPEELAAIGASWVERRTREFLTGRAAAAEALRAVGLSGPVARGADGEPLWPEGVVGAITHTRGIAAAVAAPRSLLLGLGIDLEPADRRVTPGVSRMVCTARERAWVDADGALDGVLRPGLLLKLVFCAKESIFKATFPHARVHLNYHDAEVELGAGTLGAVLLRDAGPELPAGTALELGYRLLELGEQPDAPGPERSGSYLMTHLAIASRARST